MRTSPPVFATALVLLLIPTIASPTTWHILPDGSGDAPTIQAGIDSAAVGDTVLLGDGTFRGGGNRDIVLSLGGIALISASRSPNTCILDCEGTSADPHRGFSIVDAGGEGVLLEGFSVRGGYTPDNGGAILTVRSVLAIRNVLFRKNIAVARGGAVHLSTSSEASIHGCVFQANEAEDGGGVWIEGASAEIATSVFEGNRAATDENIGGGLGCWEATVTLKEVSFLSNMAGYAGGIFFFDSGADLSNCIFDDNVADFGCGGIYATGYPSSYLNLNHCSFTRNRSVFAAGALYIGMYQALFEDCFFQSNVSAYGGAVFLSGNGDFLRCRFERNSALRNAGAVLGDACQGEFRECLFLENTAVDSGGAYLAYNGGALRIDGCTLQGNRADYGSGILAWDFASLDIARSIVSFGGVGAAVDVGSNANALLSCSDLFGNEGGDWVGSIAGQFGVDGNFSVDPLFCGAEKGDVTLDAASPCLPGNHPNGYACGLIGAYGQGCDVGTAVADGGGILITEMQLLAWPNPASDHVTLRYSLPKGKQSAIHVYDIRGRVVRSMQAMQPSGVITWDGADAAGNRAAPGVYFLRLSNGEKSETRRVTLVR